MTIDHGPDNPMNETPAAQHIATPAHERTWLDRADTRIKLVYGLAAFCGLLLVVDFFVPKHGPFAIEHWFGFYGLFALVASCVIAVLSGWLRALVSKPEDYYDA